MDIENLLELDQQNDEVKPGTVVPIKIPLDGQTVMARIIADKQGINQRFYLQGEVLPYPEVGLGSVLVADSIHAILTDTGEFIYV